MPFWRQSTEPIRDASLLDWLFWICALSYLTIGLWSIWGERRANQGRQAPAFADFLALPIRMLRTAVNGGRRVGDSPPSERV